MIDDWEDLMPVAHDQLPGQLQLPYALTLPALIGQLMQHPLLVTSLQAAVPLWILQLRDVPFEDKQRRAQECAQIVAEKGDVIMFKGGKRGETAAAFNALAEGIAILSFAPGGVTVFGQHWDAETMLGRLDETVQFLKEPDLELQGVFDGLLDGVL